MPYWIQVFDLTLPLIIHGAQRRHIVCLPLSSLICKESVSSRSSCEPVLRLCCPPPHMPGARHTRGWSGVISIPGSRDVNFIMLAPPNSSPRLCLCISSAPLCSSRHLPHHRQWSPTWHLSTYSLPPPSICP